LLQGTPTPLRMKWTKLDHGQASWRYDLFAQLGPSGGAASERHGLFRE
jgi:hypothetical protein